MIKHKTRKQRFKDLMRHRTTIEQGLTFRQIFCEVYSDVVEKHVGKRYDSTDEFMPGNIEHMSDETYQKVRYLRRVMKQVRETDDEFRWLSPSAPIKTNKVDKTTGKKLRPYVEYRHFNIKASETPDLLDEVIEYWNKHVMVWGEGIRKSRERAELRRTIAEMTSTPDQQEKLFEIVTNAVLFKFFPRFFANNTTIDNMVKELKQEGRLPSGQYKLNYGYLTEVIRKEITNEQSLTNIFSSLPSSSTRQWINEVRNLVKDTIEAYSDKERLKAEAEENAKRTAK